MVKRSNRISLRATLVAILAMAALSGCALTDKATAWLRGGSAGSSNEATVIGAPTAETYLAELYELAAGDEFKQADIYDDASSSVKLTPGPSSSLRLGLVLATPGHAAADPVLAQTLLRGVLDQEELLTREELALATIHLASAERLAGAAAETERVRDASSRAARTEEQALSRREHDHPDDVLGTVRRVEPLRRAAQQRIDRGRRQVKSSGQQQGQQEPARLHPPRAKHAPRAPSTPRDDSARDRGPKGAQPDERERVVGRRDAPVAGQRIGKIQRPGDHAGEHEEEIGIGAPGHVC